MKSIIFKIGLLALQVIFCVSALQGEINDSGHSQYILPCYKITSPIKIDGKLDEEVWKMAEPKLLVDIVTGENPKYPVYGRLLWDNKYLYVGFEIEDPNVWAMCNIRDAVMYGGKPFNESFVKVFIDPDGDGRNYVEIHVNPLNNVYDVYILNTWARKTQEKLCIPRWLPCISPDWIDWDCKGLKSATKIEGTINDFSDKDKGWSVEIAIPFSSLKKVTKYKFYPPHVGDIWKIHLARRYVSKVRDDPKNAFYWTWPPSGEVQCHRVDTWGNLIFWEKKLKIDPYKWEKALGKIKFSWKALWVAHPPTTLKEIKKMVGLTKKMGFNVLIIKTTGSGGKCWYNSKILNKPKNIQIDPLKEIIKEGKKKKLEVYSWIINLGSLPPSFYKTHPEYLQVVKPEEEEMANKPWINPDRPNLCWGKKWLCPDRGLIDEEKRIIEEIVKNYDVDGIALDYVGYRNYYACFCEYSKKKREKYANEHPELSKWQVLKEFSEQSLVDYVKQIREVVKKINPKIKLAIHIYPDFDPNPGYGNKLLVNYCGQTIAWFFKPFWSYERIYRTGMKYLGKEGEYYRYNKFIPFIGVFKGKLKKSPERLRTEIRIAGNLRKGKVKGIMIAFYETLLEYEDLSKVISEELND